MNRHVAFLAALGVAAVLAMRVADADEEGEENEPPLHKAMKSQKKAMKGIHAAVEKKKKKVVQENAHVLVESAKKVPELIPAEITKDEDKEKFLEFSKAFTEACAALGAAAGAEGGDDKYWGSVREAFGLVGESCQACHNVFAKEDEEEHEEEEEEDHK